MEGIIDAAQWASAELAAEVLPDKIRFAVEVCLEELITNIVRHGGTDYWEDKGERPHHSTYPLNIDVGLSTDPKRVVLTVEDDGNPFDIETAPDHHVDEPLSTLKPGGLGIHLIRQFADSLKHEQTGHGNRVTVEFMR